MKSITLYVSSIISVALKYHFTYIKYVSAYVLQHICTLNYVPKQTDVMHHIISQHDTKIFVTVFQTMTYDLHLSTNMKH